MRNGFKLSAVIPAKPSEIYKMWLSSKGHSAMTGSTAKVTGKVGGKFSAWDGYIFGKTLELEPERRDLSALFDWLPVYEPAVFCRQLLDRWFDNTLATVLEVGLGRLWRFHGVMEFVDAHLAPSVADGLA